MRLFGSITALATPFTASGELDLQAWRRLLQLQLESGTQGVVVAGSTGEAAALGESEYDTLLRTAVEVIGGRIPVLVGTGLSNTAKTIVSTRRAAALGADAALVVTPPYVRPTAAGLLAHYRAVADADALPIVLYNVPGRTGCDLLPKTVAELAQHERVIGVKEANDDPERMRALLDLRTERFAVLSGDDPTAVRAMLAGADGVISVASNVAPRMFRRLCDAACAEQPEVAERLNAQLLELYAFLSVEPNPIPVKAILALQGIGAGLRLPLTKLDEAHVGHAQRMHDMIDSLESSQRDTVAAD